MTENAMMHGTYADLKIVKTRRVIQMVIEFPIEASKEFTDVFGMPQPDVEQWVVVARLRQEAIRRNETASRAIQEAGILCKTASFGEWLRDHRGMSEINPSDPNSIADGLRAILGIRSRSELSTDKDALFVWNSLKSAYDNHMLS